MMAIIALAMFVVYGVIAFGLRTWMQLRKTGDHGFRGISGHPGSIEWWGGILFVLAILAGIGGPISDLAGFAPFEALEVEWIQTLGAVLALIGIAATFAAQTSMGSSWRIGVDETETTTLVTGGAFALVRNPIFTAMLATAAGLFLMVPNIAAAIGLVMLFLAVQIQVRRIEEPYLNSEHGNAWEAYTVQVGRFLPGIGTTAARTTEGTR